VDRARAKSAAARGRALEVKPAVRNDPRGFKGPPFAGPIPRWRGSGLLVMSARAVAVGEKAAPLQKSIDRGGNQPEEF